MNRLLQATRIGAVAGAVGLTATLATSAPAQAAPSASGNVSSYMYVNTNVGCTATPSYANASKSFKRVDNTRKATVDRVYTVASGADVAADGRAKVTTGGDATGSRNAFSKVVFTANQQLRLRNDNAAACGSVLTADSQSSATVKVNRNGRIKLAWQRNKAGGYQDFYLAKNGGNTLISIFPTKAKGTRSVAVSPGTYSIFTQFQTTINEGNVGMNQTKRKTGVFKAVWTFKRN